MTTNPFFNAIIAFAYILLVVTVISVGTHFAGPEPDNNFLMPVGMISLLVLSTATMAYIFFYQPISMLLDGKRKDAVHLFMHTVAIFACLTFCILLVALVVL